MHSFTSILFSILRSLATYVVATLSCILALLVGRGGSWEITPKSDSDDPAEPTQNAPVEHAGFYGKLAPFDYSEFSHWASASGGAVVKLANSLHENEASLRRSIGGKLHMFEDYLVSDISNKAAVAREAFEDVKTVLIAVAESAGEIEATIRKHAEGKSTDGLAHEMSGALSPVREELQRLFPPPETAPSHEERKQVVSSTLNSVENALVELGLKFNVDGEQMRSLARGLCSHLEELIVLIGDLSEQHPNLRSILISCVTSFISTRMSGWLLRPALNTFGFDSAALEGPFASRARSALFGAALTNLINGAGVA
ncbi:hypothetical protein K474DRAFT_1704634 [Panus rudis PR-1116 ss-1]|nr:hypothetical protein K474DRAFT_1704634 [Panus rudis PR-1116 ss-1]